MVMVFEMVMITLVAKMGGVNITIALIMRVMVMFIHHHGGEDEENELVGVGLLGKRSNRYSRHPPSYSWIQ